MKNQLKTPLFGFLTQNILPTISPSADPTGSTDLHCLAHFCWQFAVHRTCLANIQFWFIHFAHIDLRVIFHAFVFIVWRLWCSPWTSTLNQCFPFMAKLGLMNEIRPMKGRCSQPGGVQECRPAIWDGQHQGQSNSCVMGEDTHKHTHMDIAPKLNTSSMQTQLHRRCISGHALRYYWSRLRTKTQDEKKGKAKRKGGVK